jgi:hypothetical protein
MASGWTLYKFPQGQPLCTGLGYAGAVYFDRLDCGFGFVSISGTTPTSSVDVQFIDSDGVVQATELTSYREEDVAWEFSFQPTNSWSAGPVTLRISNVDGIPGNFGEMVIYLNQLGASVAATGSGYAPGDAVSVAGRTYQIDQIPPLAGNVETDVPATFNLQVSTPDGDVRGPFGPFTADSNDGTFAVTLPAAATAGITADETTNYQATLAVEVVDATYNDLLTGSWGAARAGAGSITLSVPPDALILETRFLS